MATTSLNMEWSKFVTIDPPVALSFKQHADDERPYTWINIKNK